MIINQNASGTHVNNTIKIVQQAFWKKARKMGAFITSLLQGMGGQAATGLLSEGIGLLTQGLKNKQQLKQAGKLQDLALQGYYKQTDYNTAKQLQLWKDTGPVGQMEQLDKAGLNPGLIYGMGGAGGQTASITPGQTMKEQAHTAEPTPAMGMQLGMLKAQVDNLNADTTLKLAEAKKKAGADTSNVEANTKLIEMDTEWHELQKNLLNATFIDQAKAIENNSAKTFEELHQLEMQNQLTEETFQAEVNKRAAESIGALLENAMKESNMKVNEARIKQIANEILQGWKGLSIQEQEMRIRKFTAEFQANHPGVWNVLGGAIQRIADAASKPLNERTVK